MRIKYGIFNKGTLLKKEEAYVDAFGKVVSLVDSVEASECTYYLFTGCCDKEGGTIYDGHIVSNDKFFNDLVVTWDPCTGLWMLQPVTGDDGCHYPLHEHYNNSVVLFHKEEY